MFSTNAPLLTFRIDISGLELAALQKDDRSYVRGTVSVGTTVLRDVALRVKGNGSRRPLNEKPSFVTKFDHYVPDQEFFGLTKLALNNSSQDPTYLADFMANEMFREADVPVSRVTHARVILNGRDLGLYVVVEMHNKEFLQRWFGNSSGSLYEAYVQDIDQHIDLDNGLDRTQSDRLKLLETVKIGEPSERWQKLAGVLDVDRYVSHLVCELFTAHTDGYAMNRNNYRLYHNPNNERFTFIAHGVDWAFGNTGVSMQPPLGALVTKAVMTTPEGARLFRERRGTLFTNVFQLEVLTNRVNCVAARLLTLARNANETNDFLRCARDMNGRLTARWQNITNQLFGVPAMTLNFDGNGIARLNGWRKKTDKDSPPALHNRVIEGSRRLLHIKTTSETNGYSVASWRTKVTLPAGTYLFEGDLRSAGIITQTNNIGLGAGLRLSGEKQRQNALVDDAPWTRVQHSVTNAVDAEVELVAELRALKGEVWFDEDSLRIVRRK